MQFEFDANKSKANVVKHHIDFLAAQQLWADPYRIEIPARTASELRFFIIGKIGQKVWSAVVTY